MQLSLIFGTTTTCPSDVDPADLATLEEMHRQALAAWGARRKAKAKAPRRRKLPAESINAFCGGAST